ncbi:hypothetical protein [uncultured Tenacibaculum sp.]|uniref:tetratricopeptide repeat protein n=1 Tax=uncultured Tenacibaculum sp. TaxID=174713 RepID=UPI00262E4C77|nr:hypothetical protein [uncultured Tenacibaculum sp.]
MKRLLKSLLLLIIFLINHKGIGQSSMDRGFNYLEKGNFKDAEIFFKSYLKEYPANKTAKLCYGRAVGLNGDPVKAKLIFNELLTIEPENLEFNINAAECLLWNKEYDIALKKYLNLSKKYQSNPIIQLGLANTYSNLKKFSKAIYHYNKGINLDPKILGIYIGLAYTHLANNQNKAALKTIDKALLLDKSNTQLLNLKKTIRKKYTPKIHQKLSITSDSGDNQSINSNTEVIYPLSTKLSIGGYYNYRVSTFLLNNDTSKQTSIGLKTSYNLTNKIQLEGEIGSLKVKGAANYNDVTYKIGLKTRLAYNQNFNIYYQKEYHNFNVQLINSKISQNHLFANYHILTKYDIGLFTQYYYTKQSDENSRNLLFTSLYYLINKKTPIKVGLNSVIMGFDKERANVYFSPEKYYVFEAFIDFSLFPSSKKWITKGNAAYGYQLINEDPKQQSFRAELYIGYKPSEKIIAQLYGKYSNQAVGNASGFEFNDIGIELKINL